MRSRRAYQIPLPKRPPDGLIQSFVFPLAQPPMGVCPRQQPPATSVPIDGAAVSTAPHIFPLSQPLNRRSYQITARGIARSGAIRDPSSAFPFIVPMLQPDRTQRPSEAYRAPIDVTPAIHQGPVIVTNTDVYVVAPQLIRGRGYLVTPRAVAHKGLPAVIPNADVFRVIEVNPFATYYQRPAPVLIRRTVTGPTAVIPNTLFQPSQPTSGWWAVLETAGRAIRGLVTPSFTGVSVQETSLFPADQPDRRGWYVPRAQSVQAVRTEGASLLPSFVFTFTQPERAAYYVDKPAPRTAGPDKQLTGVFVPPAAPQTYIFEPGQPSRTKWYVPRTPSEQVPAPIQTTGATVRATHPIPTVSEPDRSWWQWRLSDLMTGAVDRVTTTAGPNILRFRRTFFGKTGTRRRGQS